MAEVRQVRLERSHWRDEELSLRHREWGFDCPATDIDFLMLEYNHAIPTAIIDYKLRTLNSREPDRNSSSHQASGKLTCGGKPLPYLVVFYMKGPWVFRLIPMNDIAQSLIRRDRVLSERQYVTWLYKLRGIPLPLHIAQKLSTYCPPKNDMGLADEPLDKLLADAEVEQAELFLA